MNSKSCLNLKDAGIGITTSQANTASQKSLKLSEKRPSSSIIKLKASASKYKSFLDSKKMLKIESGDDIMNVVQKHQIPVACAKPKNQRIV